MICPNCQVDTNVTEQQYGALYTCLKCQAVYFINFEGRPEFGDTEPLELIENEEKSRIEQIEALEKIPISEIQIANIPSFNSEPIALQNDIEDPISLHQSQETPELDMGDQLSPNMDPLVQFNQNDFSSDVNPFEAMQIQNSQQIGSFADAAKDISNFGNSEMQIAHLNYDLKISGLDSAEIMKLFKEAIEDSRFGWDANEMMKMIKRGEFFFEKLNPVKAYILAKRLQFVDIEKKWVQNAIG